MTLEVTRTMPDDTTTTVDDTDTTDDTTPEPTGKRSLEELLGDLGDEERGIVLGELNKARKQAAQARTKLREAEPLAAQARALQDASRTEQERAAAAAQAAEARVQAANRRLVSAEVRAHAARDFADPDDAAAFLDLDSYIDDDGDVDTNAIQSDLADLLQRKPHLAVKQNGMRPDLSQGTSGSKNRPPASPAERFAEWWKAGTPS